MKNAVISEATRRDIVEMLTKDHVCWHGRFGEVEFLSRMFPREKLPSTDPRPEFTNALDDIWQHRVRNNDWGDDWIFFDGRFGLLPGTDEVFLRFLPETLHPLVRPDTNEAKRLLEQFNERLRVDGYELVEHGRISGRPVFEPRRITGVTSDDPLQTAANQARIVKIPNSAIYAVGAVLGGWYYSHSRLNTLFGGNGFAGDPPPGNCVLKCQEWLRRANASTDADPLELLGRVLAEFMNLDLHEDPRWQEGFDKITDVLAKNGLTFELNGVV